MIFEPTTQQVGAAVLEYDSHTLHQWPHAPDLRTRMTAMAAALRVALRIRGDITMSCEARQYSDQMSCGRCGLAWDMNDPEPPQCAPKIDRRAIPERRHTNEAKRRDPRFVFASGSPDPFNANGNRRFYVTTTKPVPVELPESFALELAEVYERHRAAGFGGIEAMKAAYRIFLDKLP